MSVSLETLNKLCHEAITSQACIARNSLQMAAKISTALLVMVASLSPVLAQNFDAVGGTGGLIGIIITCIVMLLFCFGAFFGFVVVGKCRMQNKPSDNTADQQARRAHLEDGCALPVDIPVAALAREPPPRYDSIDEPTNVAASVSGRGRSNHVSVIGDNPPAYSEAVTSLDDRIVSSRRSDFRSAPFQADTGRRFDSPPNYRSRIELDASRFSVPEHTNLTSDASLRIFPPPMVTSLRAGSVSAAGSRLHSVDSFPDIPSMSDVLLTSSRTSLPTSGVQAAALDAAASTSSRSSRQPGLSTRPASSSSRRPKSAIVSARSFDHASDQSSGADVTGRNSACPVSDRSQRHGTSSGKHRRRRTAGNAETSSSLERSSTTGVAANPVVLVTQSTDSTTGPAGSSAGVSSLSRSLPGLSSVDQELPENLSSATATTSSMATLKVVGLETVV